MNSYTLCATVTQILKQTCFPTDFGMDSMVRVPRPSLGELLAMLCQSSLSIKFPYVLLYVLIRAGPPCHFLEFWASRSAITWCRALWSYLANVAIRAWGFRCGWLCCCSAWSPQSNDTLFYVLCETVCAKQCKPLQLNTGPAKCACIESVIHILYNPSVCFEAWCSFPCML